MGDGLTLYTLPRAWVGHYGDQQWNAVTSWLLLEPRPTVILFGDDAGTAEAAAELGCMHLPGLGRNEHGTPYVADVFRLADEAAPSEVMAFVNTDIVLMQDFADALARVAGRFWQFCMGGQRRDLDIRERLDFADGWQGRLRERAEDAPFYTTAGSDYFAHRRGLYGDMPPFLIGRSSWDNWLMAYPQSVGAPLVDATACVCAVHQEVPAGKVSSAVSALPRHAEEIAYNRRLLADTFGAKAGRLTHADWALAPAGFIRR